MQQLYARIKKTSKYYGQNGLEKQNIPFPVEVGGRDAFAQHIVVGGPGGSYRLADVRFYVKRINGELIAIS